VRQVLKSICLLTSEKMFNNKKLLKEKLLNKYQGIYLLKCSIKKFNNKKSFYKISNDSARVTIIKLNKEKLL